MNKLQKEIEKELSLTNPDASKLEDFIYLLQEKLNKAEEVIRFYASNESWLCSMDSSIGDSITAFDYEENSSITKRRFVGGKRAREFLKKLEGEK